MEEAKKEDWAALNGHNIHIEHKVCSKCKNSYPVSCFTTKRGKPSSVCDRCRASHTAEQKNSLKRIKAQENSSSKLVTLLKKDNSIGGIMLHPIKGKATIKNKISKTLVKAKPNIAQAKKASIRKRRNRESKKGSRVGAVYVIKDEKTKTLELKINLKNKMVESISIQNNPSKPQLSKIADKINTVLLKASHGMMEDSF